MPATERQDERCDQQISEGLESLYRQHFKPSPGAKRGEEDGVFEIYTAFDYSIKTQVREGTGS